MDPNSFANTRQVKLTHAHLDLQVDFNEKKVKGRADLDFKVVDSNLKEIVLDTSFLDISSISFPHFSKIAKFQVHERKLTFGSPLHIEIPSEVVQSNIRVSINYSTTDQCTALAWLTPEQTNGKRHPYVFSQCQAIHARSLFPCQDTPSIKFTYTAKILVPKPLVALMSAVLVGSPKDEGNLMSYSYSQDVVVPSYLLALAVGDIESRKIGPRSHVWSEKELVDKAAYEFVDTEKFISTGEDLTTPYIWGKYDILVLPSGFPYGGMENPCLTFVTPSLIAGDRSLVNVIAHEIAHSWAGNLVTSFSWEHFWLNEGFTVFIERKIVGRLHGEKMRHFQAILGFESLEKSIEVFGETSPLTALVPNLTDVDPDDAFSSVPYEKGFNFLFYLEKLVGGAEVFEPFLKAYIRNFQYQSVTSEQFRTFFLSYFAYLKEKLNEIDWTAWFDSPGMPPVKNEFDQTLYQACLDLKNKWEAANSSSNYSDFNEKDYSSLSPEQRVVFLNDLHGVNELSHLTLNKMDEIFHISKETNCEICLSWYLICLKNKFESVYSQVVKFLGQQGRMKYIRPLFRALEKCNRDLALETYQKYKPSYHPIAQRQVAIDLKIE